MNGHEASVAFVRCGNYLSSLIDSSSVGAPSGDIPKIANATLMSMEKVSNNDWDHWLDDDSVNTNFII